MSNKKQAPPKRELTAEELDDQHAAELPDREAMSIINPSMDVGCIYPATNPTEVPHDPMPRELPVNKPPVSRI